MKKSLFTAALLLTAWSYAGASVNTDAAKDNYTETQWEHYAAAEFAGGTGTKDDPYLIATPEQFAKLAVEIENLAADDNNWDNMYTDGVYFLQTADLVFNNDVMGKTSWDEYGDQSGIDATGLRTFGGIGYQAGEYDYQRFSGYYDGGGHSIKGVYLKGEKSSTGLFNFTEGGEIKNLVVEDTYMSGNANVGIIVGTADGTTVINCQTSGTIYCGGSYHAGLVGTLTGGGKVLNCVTYAWTWGKNNIAGLVGSGRNTSLIQNCYFGGWLGGVGSNLASFKWWGAVCPELGKSELTTTIPDPEDPTGEGVITICENPSKAVDCFWTDTCTVRHKRLNPIKWLPAEAYNEKSNCDYGVFENCKKVALAEVSTIVDELNKKAQEIDGACQWKVGEDGLPSLVFETSTGIGSITVEGDADGVYDVFDVTGKLVMKGARGTADLDRLARGVYIMNGKKYVIK